MQTTYVTTVYDYLVTNNILDQFLHNRKYFTNSANDRKCHNEPINYAIIWQDTPEGHAFWNSHNDTLAYKLRAIHCIITIAELIEQLNILMQFHCQPQPYEFW